MRPVFVCGVGWHCYQKPSSLHYCELGLKAVRDALVDAGITWDCIEQTFIGTALLGMAAGRPLLKHLGGGGQPLVHIENASASGSAAFQIASHYVASGLIDVALVLGIDKRPPSGVAVRARPFVQLEIETAIAPMTHFALLSDQYIQLHGATAEDIGRIAIKNHRNGALNHNAQRQTVRSLEEVMSRPVSGILTTLQCCPVGEGAAAAIVMSEQAIKRLNVDSAKVIRVAASAANSETCGKSDTALTEQVVHAVLEDAKILPTAIDLFECHDAFSIEEALYVEAAGICERGKYLPMLKEGAFDIGGQCAVSTSGGLIAMGHPIGPTGVGQIGELVLQLRGEAGPRQHSGARVGIASMVGIGAVGYAHLLTRD